MNISIIGTGYVGLPTGIGLASIGHNVTCIDVDQVKIDTLNQGKLTLYEKDLPELFSKTLHKTLNFSTTYDSVEIADVVLIAVGTPMNKDTKAADLRYVYEAAKTLAPKLKNYTVICDKSTVPVGTGKEVEQIIRNTNPDAKFDVVSLPEFLREGFAVEDFYFPDRIVIGTDSVEAYNTIMRMYKPLLDLQNPQSTKILKVTRESAETIKYASNSFLAVKIHFINEIADFCEKVGANVHDVAKGMGLDTRIGPKFLQPGPGYGGSCFPKDTNAMSKMASDAGIRLELVDTAIKGNDNRKLQMAKRILESAPSFNAKIAVLGLAFKAGTDDCRDSPAMDIAIELYNQGVEVIAYDPKAMDIAKTIHTGIKYANSIEVACSNADVIAILTEWHQFKHINWELIKELSPNAIIIDLRSMLDASDVTAAGLKYKTIGM